MIEGGSIVFPPPSIHTYAYISKYMHAYEHTLFHCSGVLVFLASPDLLICRNMDISEIQKSGNTEIMCNVCMFVGSQI